MWLGRRGGGLWNRREEGEPLEISLLINFPGGEGRGGVQLGGRDGGWSEVMGEEEDEGG